MKKHPVLWAWIWVWAAFIAGVVLCALGFVTLGILVMFHPVFAFILVLAVYSRKQYVEKGWE